MDSSGVPQKINRHVMKALFQNSREGLKFGELIEYVRLCNRNLRPVDNFNQTVHKSLKNFLMLGLIVKDERHRYKMVELALSHPKGNNKLSIADMRPESSRAAQKRSFAQKRNSDESIHEVDEATARKRRKLQDYDVGNRNKKTINLPRNKRQFAGQLDLESKCPFSAEDSSSRINYDDESLLREPGDDDRDSGDDLRVKEDNDQNKEKGENPEQNANPTEEMPLENDPDGKSAT